jgi:hypothetical protein
MPVKGRVDWGMLFAVAGVLALTGCAGAGLGDNAQAEPPRFSHPQAITNPYLPLASLKQDVLENESGRVERTAKPELHKTFRVGGQTVEALVVEDRDYENSKLTEVTLDYFAQDDDGIVYYLGEDVDEYKGGRIVSHGGAWLWGKDTPHPGVLMPAHPRVGDRFQAEDVPHVTREKDEVVSVSETVTVPAGTYTNCVKIKEQTSDGDTEYKFYAPGVGCVREVESDGELVLNSHATR